VERRRVVARLVAVRKIWRRDKWILNRKDNVALVVVSKQGVDTELVNR
jgi:hypothetical protein